MLLMIRWKQLVRLAQGDRTQRETRETLDMAVAALTDAVTRGEEVVLRGFGTFKAVHRGAKAARHIKKGESLTIPPHMGVSFRAAKAFREKVAAGRPVEADGQAKGAGHGDDC